MSPIASTREQPADLPLNCPKCGAQVKPPKSPNKPVTCPSCGTQLQLDSNGNLVPVS